MSKLKYAIGDRVVLKSLMDHQFSSVCTETRASNGILPSMITANLDNDFLTISELCEGTGYKIVSIAQKV